MPSDTPVPPDHDARLSRLDAAIASARTRLGERSDLDDTDIGGLLEVLNDEMAEARQEDPVASAARLDRLEAQLDEVETRLVEGVVPD